MLTRLIIALPFARNLPVFARRLVNHLRNHLWGYPGALALAILFQHCFGFGLNTTESLPHRLYLIQKGAPVKRGDYVAFRWEGGGPYWAGVTFIKIAAGVPGDTVSRIDREYFVNGSHVGRAKTHGSNGQPLALMDTGVLGADEYYVQAPHPDSLDSRYRMTGWIPKDRIVGRAYALF